MGAASKWRKAICEVASDERGLLASTHMTNSRSPDWTRIARDPAFSELKRARRRFVIPATIFFLVYYIALPVLVGYFPELMKQAVIGKVNWAYLFALSQFIMAWIMAALYVRVAARWDRMNEALLSRLGH